MPVGQTIRRAVIAGLGSMAVWPLVARAQQPEQMRRIGRDPYRENDPQGQLRATAFRGELEKAGLLLAAIFKLISNGARATPIACAPPPSGR